MDLSAQLKQYDTNAPMAVLKLRTMLEDESFVAECIAEGRQRLIKAYPTFKSRMYKWIPLLRRMNVVEEVADTIVYIQSGPI